MANVVPTVRKGTLQPIVDETVKLGSAIQTDKLRSYVGLDRAGFWHETVNHSAGEYVS